MNEPERRYKARVLVIEHSESVARVAMHSLKSPRIYAQWIPLANVFTCLKTWKPHLIIIGDDLDGICGIDVCTNVRTVTFAPIIILTECEAAGHHIRAFESGADDIVVRPICPPVFLSRVNSQLRRSYRYSVMPSRTHERQEADAIGV